MTRPALDRSMLVLAQALALLATSVPLAAQERAGEPRGGEPAIKRSVIEDDGVRIDELRVRGAVTSIHVQPKGALGGKGYEILPGDASRDLAPGHGSGRGAAGQRVWRIGSF